MQSYVFFKSIWFEKISSVCLNSTQHLEENCWERKTFGSQTPEATHPAEPELRRRPSARRGTPLARRPAGPWPPAPGPSELGGSATSFKTDERHVESLSLSTSVTLLRPSGSPASASVSALWACPGRACLLSVVGCHRCRAGSPQRPGGHLGALGSGRGAPSASGLFALSGPA